MKNKRMIKVQAGRMVRVVIYTQPSAADEPGQRAAKARVSSEARRRINQRCSWQKCEERMAANFDREDLFVTLTYRDECLPPTREAAQRCLNAFLRLLRVQRAGRGESLLYIKNAEHLNDDGTEGRWHHHLVLNGTGADFEEIRALWARWGDDIDIEPLLADGEDYASRARYICKERPPAGKQAWTPSRNLREPERTSELVDEALTVTAPPGAVILEQSQTDNGWGNFVYLKYLLPYKPRRRTQRRSRTEKRNT